MWFLKSKRPAPVAAALTRARAVLTVFDNELFQLAADLERPGDVQPQGANRGLPDVAAVESSLIALEESRAEATADAATWRHRAKLAGAAGRDDLAAQANRCVRIATAAVSAYTEEIDAVRAFLAELPSPTRQSDRKGQ